MRADVWRVKWQESGLRAKFAPPGFARANGTTERETLGAVGLELGLWR